MWGAAGETDIEKQTKHDKSKHPNDIPNSLNKKESKHPNTQRRIDETIEDLMQSPTTSKTKVKSYETREN